VVLLGHDPYRLEVVPHGDSSETVVIENLQTRLIRRRLLATPRLLPVRCLDGAPAEGMPSMIGAARVYTERAQDSVRDNGHSVRVTGVKERKRARS
jgi:hypothetical protein